MLRLVCPKCQHEQDSADECEFCGLILSRYREEAVIPQEGNPSKQISFRSVRLLFLIPSLVAVLLLLVPSSPPPLEADPEAPARMERKLEATRDQVRQGKSSQLRLDEWEVNSWLEENLTTAMTETQKNLEADWQQGGKIQDLVVSFVEDRMQIHLQFKVLAKDMSLTLRGRLRTDDRRLWLDIDSGSIGSLPLPGSILQRAMSNVFESPENASKFLLPDGIGEIRIEGSELVVEYLSPETVSAQSRERF